MGTPGRRDGERSQVADTPGEAVAESTLHDLQKENETLKELVVSLSELVIRRVADQR
jgi:hypothetical protein